MNDRERANKALGEMAPLAIDKDGHEEKIVQMVDAIERAIREGRREERELCAKVAEKVAASYSPNLKGHFGGIVVNAAKPSREVAEFIAERIRGIED